MIIKKRNYVNIYRDQGQPFMVSEWHRLASAQSCQQINEFASGFVNDNHLGGYMADYTRLEPLGEAENAWQIRHLLQEAEQVKVRFFAFVAPDSAFFNHLKAVLSHLASYEGNGRTLKAFSSCEMAEAWLREVAVTADSIAV